MNWREVEQALVEIAKSNGHFIDDNKLGNKIIDIEQQWIGNELNLTEIAKELVDRLGRKS